MSLADELDPATLANLDQAFKRAADIMTEHIGYVRMLLDACDGDRAGVIMRSAYWMNERWPDVPRSFWIIYFMSILDGITMADRLVEDNARETSA
jgi:hypothetical protein